MDKWSIHSVSDLKTGLVQFDNRGPIHAVKGDALSIEWKCDVLNNGVPADISSYTCTVYANRPDKASALTSATISGNQITAVLPNSFFAIVGKVHVMMILASSGSGVAMTVSEMDFNVSQGPYDRIIDPGEVVPGIQEGLIAIRQMSQFIVPDAYCDDVVQCETNTDEQHSYTVTYEDGASFGVYAYDSEVQIEEL